MTCQHDPLQPDCSLLITASMNGTDILCGQCGIAAVLNAEGETLERRRYRTSEQRPALPEFTFNPDPSYVPEWQCSAGATHRTGEVCTCTQK